MTEINHAQLTKLLKHYYNRRMPLFIWGTIGIGKSTIVKEVSKQIAQDLKLGFIDGEPDGEDKFGFVDVRISQLEPSDLRGLPSISNGDTVKTTTWILPDWLPRNKNSKGIIFFDELNLAPPMIQASAYQLILDRRLGSYRLPDGWVILSAGNTISDRANVYDLPKPLANRFMHVELKTPSKEEWNNWAIPNKINTLIIAFLEFKPNYLYTYSKDTKDKAFATPRSWEFCSKLIDSSEEITNTELKILIGSSVGDGIATEFMAFLKLRNEIDIKEILKNPEKVKAIKEIDIKYALLSGLSEMYRNDKEKIDKILPVCEYLEPEFAILLLRFMYAYNKDHIRSLLTIDKKDKSKAQTNKIFTSLLDKYAKYLV